MPMVRYVQVVTFNDLPEDGLTGYSHSTKPVSENDLLRKNGRFPGMFGMRSIYMTTIIEGNIWIFCNTNFGLTVNDRKRVIRDAKRLVAGFTVENWSQHDTHQGDSKND